MKNDAFTVDADALIHQLDELSDMQTSISEATGSLRARLKEIIETDGYHKKAMAIIRQINAMSETQRADFLRTFEPMFEAMMEAKWRSETEDMFGE